MTTRPTLLVLAFTAIFLSPDFTEGGNRNSLWSRRKPQRVHLFFDTQARHKGDLLTIVVGENTSITNRDTRALSKDSSTGGKLAFSSSTAGDLGLSSALADVDHDTSTDRDFNGKSQFSSSRGFSDRITVRVVAVLPNGNLYVAGTRRILVEDDERYLSIAGVVRPVDIQADNSVLSHFVGNLRVNFTGRGDGTHFTRQGWLNRKVNRIWPF